MRIEWNGASAQLVAANLDRLQEQLEASLQQAQAARIALNNANPGSDNRRLNAIAAQYDRTVIRLKQASADVERLRMGTRVMIDAFEEAERQAIGIMESLEARVKPCTMYMPRNQKQQISAKRAKKAWGRPLGSLDTKSFTLRCPPSWKAMAAPMKVAQMNRKREASSVQGMG